MPLIRAFAGNGAADVARALLAEPGSEDLEDVAASAGGDPALCCEGGGESLSSVKMNRPNSFWSSSAVASGISNAYTNSSTCKCNASDEIFKNASLSAPFLSAFHTFPDPDLE